MARYSVMTKIFSLSKVAVAGRESGILIGMGKTSFLFKYSIVRIDSKGIIIAVVVQERISWRNVRRTRTKGGERAICRKNAKKRKKVLDKGGRVWYPT